MNAPRGTDQLLKSFLAEGQAELPGRAFDAVRRDIHRTRQRVVIGPWREPRMSTLSRVALAAAVVVAVGIAWINLAPPGGPGGQPTPTPATPTAATPTASAGPALLTVSGPLQPGRYAVAWERAAGSDGAVGPTVHLTVPSSGWSSFEGFAVNKNYGPSDGEAGAAFVMWKITNRYVDGCVDAFQRTPFAPAPSEGVEAIDDLLQLLSDQPGIEAGEPTDVSVDGYAGRYFELTVAIDIETCPGEFWPWLDKYVQGSNEVLRVYALDVGGVRLTFFARIPERTTPADRAELESIIESIDIVP